jgi:imidazole glycerol phosphate synthase subunit HisF
VLTLTIGSGVTHVVEFPTTLSFGRGDKLTVKTTAVGTGATGLYVNLIGGPAN